MRGGAKGGPCIVAIGAVRFGQFIQDGAFNHLVMLGPGGHFGDIPAFLERSRGNDAYAVGRTQIDIINDSILSNLLSEEPDFARGLNRANAERLMGMMELYDDMRTLQVTERLAKVLLLHARRGKFANGVACLQRDRLICRMFRRWRSARRSNNSKKPVSSSRTIDACAFWT